MNKSNIAFSLNQPFDAKVFQKRREEVVDRMKKDVLVLFSAPVHVRNNDVEFPYRQDSDFYYLTGFEEPESVLVISNVGSNSKSILFLREKDPAKEQWDGFRLGVQDAPQKLLVDDAFPFSELSQKLPDMLHGSEHLRYLIGKNPDWDQTVMDAIGTLRSKVRQGKIPPEHLTDASPLLHEMRLRKDIEEIECMKNAAEISAKAHIEAMKLARPQMYEFELEAELLKQFRKHGSPRVAYDSIVGSGPNATVLHYRENNRKMENGDLVLIDAGCEWGFYASDITRTFPVNGKFSPEQRAIYEVVLKSQKAAIEKVKPGITFDEVHEAALHVICEGLIELKIIAGSLDEVIKEEKYKPFFMHRTSHWLGMDVHDVGSYKERDGSAKKLEPGFVLTIEPGIYIRTPENVDSKWHNIGIRIEDDVLVTENAHEVLSQSVPKEVTEIEALVGTLSHAQK